MLPYFFSVYFLFFVFMVYVNANVMLCLCKVCLVLKLCAMKINML